LADIVMGGVESGVLPGGTNFDDVLEVARRWRPTFELVQVVVREASASTLSDDQELCEEHIPHGFDVNLHTPSGRSLAGGLLLYKFHTFPLPT
jgi:hypothetical protein